jgi:hypothetical protein
MTLIDLACGGNIAEVKGGGAQFQVEREGVLV